MDTVDDFNAWDAKQQQNKAGAAQVVLNASTDTPDAVAGDLNLAHEFAKTTGGVVPPLPLVKDNRPAFQQAIDAAKNQTVLSGSPRLASWLTNPENAAIAKDDLSGLSWWEKTGANLAEVPKAIPGGAVSSVGTALEGTGQILTPADPAVRQPLMQRIIDAQNATPDELGALRQDIFKQGNINPQIAQTVLSSVLDGSMKPDEAMQQLAPMFGPALKVASQALQKGGETTENFGNSLVPARPGFENSMGRQVGSGVGSLLTILGVALATGGTGAAAFGGAMGAGQSASDARQAGADEDTQTIAAFYGIAPGMTDAIPIDRLLNNPVTKAGFASFLRAIGKQAATEGGQEAVQQIMQNMIAQNLYAPDRSMMDQVLDNFTSGGIVGAMAEAGKLGIEALLPGRFHGARAHVEQAQQTRDQLGDISTQAQSSVLRNRSPDKFRQFLETATAGTPIENVYVPADKFVQYFQGVGVDPHALADTLEGVSSEDLDAALAGGSDLQIPTATYAAKIAGTEHDAFLLDNMRFDPDAFTFEEARQFNDHADELKDEAYQTAEEARQRDEEMRSFEQQIYDTMVSRLRTAGRSTDVATTEAMLYPAFYRTMAERSGMTTEEFMQRYPLPQVAGDIPQGMQLRNVDELNRTLAAARSRKDVKDNRQSLLEFIDQHGGINDAGGELRARDAATVKRGKGKKALRLARDASMDTQADMIGGGNTGRKHGPDAVAQAAIEAGFMSDDPIVHEYQAAVNEGREVPDITRALYDHIDRELRGERQFAGEPDAAVEEAARLDQIEQYLHSLGVSLNDSDEQIRQALEGGREYGQSAFHGTPHLFSKFSTDHIGSGEGAQAYGWGLYFAENKSVAKSYRDALSGGKDGKIYNVDLPDSNELMNYDAKLNDQPPEVLAKLQGIAARVASEAEPSGRGIWHDIAQGKADLLTGRHFYDLLSEIFGSDQAASYELSKAGIPGHMFLDQGSRSVGKGTHNFVIYDGDTVGIRSFEQRGEAGARGSIQFPAAGVGNGESIIRLFESANLSTMLHESGHYFLTVMQDMAGKEAGFTPNAAGLKNEVGTGSSQDFDVEAQAIHKSVTDGTANAEDEAILPVLDGLVTRDIHGREDKLLAAAMSAGRNDLAEALINLSVSGENLEAKLVQERQEDAEYKAENPEGYARSLKLAKERQANVKAATARMLDTYNASRGGAGAATDFDAVKSWWRENASEVASDGKRVMPDVAVTADDVIAALDNGTTGDLMKDAAVDVGMQEQFARAFEAYLMEGKAPSVELRSAFEKFRSWLISIYRKLASLRVKSSPEIQNVFNRMLASDDQIRNAQENTGETAPIFTTAEAMGLSQEDYDKFLKLRTQSEEQAKARLLGEAMEPIRREQEKAYKAEKETVRGEVERNVNGFRYYRALEWMGNRRWLGEGQPEILPDMRLSKEILVDRYGAGVLETLPRGKQTVYAVEGGIDPDDAAGWFGFDSGDEMVRAMEQAPKRVDAIKAETERVMRERHGDMLNDGSAEAEALDAVHNDKRGQWIAAELKAIVDVAGTGVGLTAKEARASAKSATARMRVRDASNSQRFLAAERKAADDAGRYGAQLAREKIWLDAARRKIATTARAAIRGDGSPDAVAGAIEAHNAKFETTQSTFTVPDQERVSSKGKAFTIPGGERTTTSLGYNDLVNKLIEAKRRQLLNHALYMESRKVADEVEKAENYVARLGKKTTRDRIAGAGRRENAQIDYLGAIDELLDRYDFRRLSNAAEQRRGALNAFVERMKATGRENELAIPDDVLAQSGRAPYKTIPVEELRGVIDSLKNLEHVATRWDKLIDAQRERDLEQAVSGVVDSFDKNIKKRPPNRVATNGERRATAIRQYLDLVLNANTLLREIDGFTDQGSAHAAIKAPIDEAVNRLIVRKQGAAKAIEELYNVYSKAERRAMATRMHMPELGYALSKWEKISVALNTGNAGNLQRMTDARVPGSLTEAQVRAVLNTLDERDAKFVQSVWDYVGTFKDDIAARERRATGVEPAWVEAAPVEIAGKTLPGGYYPLKYDPRLSSAARDDAAQDIAQSLMAGRFGKAQTRNGHTKERAQASGRAVELDMSVLHRHINQVIYDLELSEPVSNSWRVLQDGRVRDAFTNSGRSADFDALESWLLDVGSGELKAGDLVSRSARMLKSNFTAAKLSVNLVTALTQVAGLAQTMVVVGKRDFAVGLQKSFRVGVSDEIAQKSAYMSQRQSTFNKDINDFYEDSKNGAVASRWNDFKTAYGKLGFWLMEKLQWQLVDVPTWLAGYNQGLRKFGNDEAKAIAHADDIVKRSQSSGLFHDRSSIERGTLSRNTRQNDVVRLFTALGSYMFAKFNIAYDRAGQAGQTFKREGVFSAAGAKAGVSLAMDMTFLFMVDAVLTAAIKGQLPSGGDDDKQDGWAAFLAKQTAFNVMGALPFIRDASSVFQGFDGGGAYGSIVGDAAKGAIGAWHAVSSPFTGNDIKISDVKGIINATGLATGVPATQINRAVDAGWRQLQGQDVSPLEYMMGKKSSK
jgi:hypothetical protein